MFPYVKSYYSHDRYNLYPGITTDKSKDGSRRKQRRICSGYYFDLYFSLTRNDYLKINLQVKKFVEEINMAITETEVTRIYQKFVNSSEEELALKVADLRLYIDEINKDKTIILCSLLLGDVKNFRKTGGLVHVCKLFLDAKSCWKILHQKMLQRCLGALIEAMIW